MSELQDRFRSISNIDIMLRYGRLPYARGADGITAFDCVSLARRYYREELGVELPKVVYTWGHVLTPVDGPPQKHDLLIMMGQNRVRFADHIAIALSPTEMLHTSQAFNGVVCEPIERYRHVILATWRLKQL